MPSATGALGDRKKETVLPAAAMLGYADLAGLEAAGVELANRCPLALARYAPSPRWPTSTISIAGSRSRGRHPYNITEPRRTAWGRSR
jgi:hypothetical protein